MIKTTYLEKPDKLIDIAVKRAKKESNHIKKREAKEERKAVLFSNYLTDRLESAISRIPSEEKLGQFRYALMLTTENERNIKNMRSHFISAKRLLAKRKSMAIKRIRRDPENSGKKFRELLGRSNSVMKSLDETIKRFNKLQKNIRELPAVNERAPAIILAGFPNVGKTTILKRITGSSPEIAEYAFTTKQINLAFFERRYHKIQVIDTPGLLDRKPKDRNQIEKKAVLALHHLDGIVCFIVDATGQVAKHKEQLSLYNAIKKEFGEKEFVLLVNKIDLATEPEKTECIETFGALKPIEFPEEQSESIRDLLGKKIIEKLLKELSNPNS